MVAGLISGGTGKMPIGCDIDLAADDRFDSPGSCCLVKLDCSVHHTVVRDSQRVHAQFLDTSYQWLDTAHPVEEAVFGVNVKMCKQWNFPEIDMRHYSTGIVFRTNGPTVILAFY
jgi:hypothetical protein